MSSPKSVKSTSVRRGRRTDTDRRSGKWRLSVREVQLRNGRYKWTTWMVQGFKNEAGKWVRRKFRSRDAAEAFVARKQMENVVPGAPQHPVITCLTPEEVNEAEVAVARLKGCRRSDGRAVSLLDAANFYAEHLKGTVDIERVPLAEARRASLQDKEKRGVLRPHTTRYVDISLRAFEKWLCRQPRYAEQSIDEDWTPDVCEVSTDDILAYLGSLRSRSGLEAAPKTKNNARADLRSFFNWCMGIEADRPLPGVSRRWHSVNPAAAIPKEIVPESVPAVLSVEEAGNLMQHVEAFKEGRLVPYFALALFAGLRPGPNGELYKLHAHPNRDEPCREASGRPLIDLVRGVLTVTADISKTRRKRVLTIQPNLRKWLARYGTEILPEGHDRDIKEVRAGQALAHDVLRHSFISYHVATFRSKANTALEAGNSESIIDAHYLNLPTVKEGKAFFSILPASRERKVVSCAPQKTREMA